MIRQTHTFAVLPVSQACYDEIATKLREAGYDHSFVVDQSDPNNKTIDMHGIAIKPEDKDTVKT